MKVLRDLKSRPSHAKRYILLVFIVLLSCTYSNREEGFVYFRLNSNPTTLDPAYVVDVTGGTLTAKLFNGLVRIDGDLNIVPDIAENWDVTSDGKGYTFYLREGVTFSNGRTVTAADFVYSFHRLLDPKNSCPNIWVLDKIQGVSEFREGRSGHINGLKVINDYTLRIMLEKPFSPFLSLLTMSSAYVVPKEEVERLGDSFGFQPVGTGPYTLTQWVQNAELILGARKDYFEGAPPVRGLVYRIIPEDLTAITEFEIGNIDILTLPASAYGRFSKDPAWKGQIVIQKGLNTYYLGFNSERPPFSDRNVRRAVGFAIDSEKILRTFYESRGRFAVGPVPDNLREWNIVYPYYYSPVRAKELLMNAGVKLPVSVDFYITSDQNVVDMAEVIQSFLHDAGFAVTIRQLEWSSYKQALNRGEADFFWLSWWADYPDPENFLYPLFHSSNLGPAGNRTRFQNSAIDELIENGQSSTNKMERNEFYRDAEQRIIDEAPWIPFWHRNDYLIKQKRVRGLTVYPIYSSDKGMEIVLSETP